MTNIHHTVEASIRSFYIFNSNYGTKEGEEGEKILYYHPKNIELNTKIKDVGLSEAIILFIKTFSDDSDCEKVHTLKTNQIFYEAEKDFWMVLTINVSKELRSNDNVEFEEYRSGKICDTYYRRLVEQAYNNFRILYGSFEMVLKCSQHEEDTKVNTLLRLQEKLEKFFDEFVTNLKIPASNLMQYMRSVQYLPLDKTLFLKVHNFMNMIKATFPSIANVLFLFNDYVVCGGKFEPVELYTIYNHILHMRVSKENNSCNNFLHEVFITHNNNLLPFNLYIYNIDSASLCLFFKNAVTVLAETKEELYNYINAELTILTNKIVAQMTGSNKLPALQITSNRETMNPKYLFVNEQTLKHLSSISNHSQVNDATSNLHQLIPSNVIHMLIDLENFSGRTTRSDKDERRNVMRPFKETLVKSTSDFWIFKRRCNWRKFYMILFSKKATLLDVTIEAERISFQGIKDDVFFDK